PQIKQRILPQEANSRKISFRLVRAITAFRQLFCRFRTHGNPFQQPLRRIFMSKCFSSLVFSLLFPVLAAYAQVPAGNFRFQNIDLPGARVTFANGINNLGQIVGFFRDSSGVAHGYLQDGDEVRIIDFPNAARTFPQTVNNAGTVAGEYRDAARHLHGFVLEHGTFTAVDVPGSTDTEILDLNDRGDLAGTYANADGTV